MLSSYHDILQVDGYAGYKKLADPTGRTRPSALAACWFHVRCGSYDLAKTRAAPVAIEALEHIAALYRIEADIRGLSPAERRAQRQRRRELGRGGLPD